MERKLLDGTSVPALDIAVTLQIHTKCPNKYKLIDMETGAEYIGQLPQEGQLHWQLITK